jgi:hypothetical protein
MQKILLYGLFAVAMISGSVAYGMQDRDGGVQYRAVPQTEKKFSGYECADIVVGAVVGRAGLQVAGYSKAVTFANHALLPYAPYLLGAGVVYWLGRAWFSSQDTISSKLLAGLRSGKKIAIGICASVGIVATLAALKKANI